MNFIYYFLTLLTLLQIHYVVCQFDHPIFSASSLGAPSGKLEPSKLADIHKSSGNTKSFSCDLDSDNDSSPRVADSAQRRPSSQPIAVDSGVDAEPRARRGPAPIAVTQAVSNAGSGAVPRKSVQVVAAGTQPSSGQPQVKSAGQSAPKSVPLDSDAESDVEVSNPSTRQSTAQPAGQAQQPAPRQRAAQPQAVAVEPQQVKSATPTAPKSVPLDSDSDIEVVNPSAKQSTAQPQQAAAQRAPQPRAVPVEAQPASAPTPDLSQSQQPAPRLKASQPQVVPAQTQPQVVPAKTQSAATPARTPEPPQPQQASVPQAPQPQAVPVQPQSAPTPASTSASTPPTPTNTSQIQYFSLELRQKITSDAYAYVWDENKYAHLFVPRYPYSISKVTDNGTLAWQHQGGKYPTEVRIEFDQQDNPSLELEFPDDSWSRESFLFALELRQKITNDAYAYVWDENKYAHLFVPRYPYSISKVTDNGTLAWQHQGGKYPTEVRIEFDQQDNPSLELEFPVGDVEQYPSSGSPQQVQSAPQTAPKSVPIQEAESDLEVVTPSSRQPPAQASAPQPQEAPRPRAPQPVPAQAQPAPAPPQAQQPAPTSKGPAKLVSVDINYFGSTEDVDYFFYERENIHKFLCKGANLIYELKRGPKVKWRYEQGDYPNRVLLFKDENDSTMIRMLSPKDTDPVEPTYAIAPYAPVDSQPKLISVDINYFGSTEDVDYFFYERENIHKFLCKGANLIYELKRGPKVKWRYEQGDYPNRVLLFKDENDSTMIRMLSPKDTDPVEPTYAIAPYAPVDSQPKLVSVDINYFGSTEDVDYFFYERENIHKFLCKGANLIYELKRGPKVKWRYEQGDYPNRVLLFKDENDSTMIRMLSPKDTDPVEPTYAIAPYAPVDSQPKLVSVDINYFGSTEDVDYFFYERENIHKFLCKGANLIYELKRGPKVKWRYEQGDYPNRVLLFKDENDSTMIRMLSPKDTDPVEPTYAIAPYAPFQPQPPSRPVQPMPPQSGLITLNVDYLQSTETVQYFYDEQNYTHIFKSRGNLLFDQVIQNGKVLWKPKNNRYGNRMVIKILPDGSQKAKMHYPDEVPSHEMPQPFLPKAPSIPEQAPEVPEEPLVGVTSPVSTGVPTDLEPGIEGGTFDRVLSPVPTAVPPVIQPTIEPEPPVMVPTPAPKRVSFDLDSDVEEARTTEFMPPSEPFDVVPTQVHPSDVSFTLESGDEARDIVSGEQVPAMEPSVVQPVAQRPEEFVYVPEPGLTPDFSPKAPINLNIKSSKSTKSYEFNKDRSKKTKIYSALPGFGFASVKFGGSCFKSEKTIWEAKDDKHFGKKVELIEYWYDDMFEINILLHDATKRKFFRTYYKPWTEVDLSSLNPVLMNISSHKDTYAHTTTTEDRFKVLAAKHPFVFNNLIQWPIQTISKKNVWSTDNPDEYVAVVFRDGLGSSYINNVTMQLINGHFAHLKKIDGIWVKKSSYIELDLSHKKSTFEYTYTKNKVSHTYEGNFDFLFTKVHFKGSGCCSSEIVLWERNDRNEFANKVVFSSYKYSHMEDAIIYFHNGSKKLFIKKQKNSWNEVNLTKRYDVALNIDDLEDTYFYSYSSNGHLGTFVAKEPFVFSSLVEYKTLRNGTKKVWEARNPNQFATKVVIDGPKRCTYTKNATLTLVNDSTLRLTRTGSLGCTPSFCCFLTLGLFNCCAKTWEDDQSVAISKSTVPTRDSSVAIDDSYTPAVPASTAPQQMAVEPEQTTSFDFDDDEGELIEF